MGEKNTMKTFRSEKEINQIVGIVRKSKFSNE